MKLVLALIATAATASAFAPSSNGARCRSLDFVGLLVSVEGPETVSASGYFAGEIEEWLV